MAAMIRSRSPLVKGELLAVIHGLFTMGKRFDIARRDKSRRVRARGLQAFVGRVPSRGALFRPRELFQRRFRRTGKNLAGGFEARAVARTVPGLVCCIPMNDAFQVRTNR